MNNDRNDQMAQDAQRIEDERLRMEQEEERLRQEEEQELLIQQGAAVRAHGPLGRRARQDAGHGAREANAAGAIPGGPMGHRASFGFSAKGKRFASSAKPAQPGGHLPGSSGASSGGSGKALGIGLLVVVVALAAVYLGTSGKVDPQQVTQVAAQWLNGSPDRGGDDGHGEPPRPQAMGAETADPGSTAPAEPKLPSAEPTVATPASDGSVDAEGDALAEGPVDVSRTPGMVPLDSAAADVASPSAASDSSHGLSPIAMRESASPEVLAKLVAIESRLDLIQSQLSRSAALANSAGSAQRQPLAPRVRSTPAPMNRASARDLTAAAKQTPAAEARSRAGQLLAVDVWGGVPSVVVGTGDAADRRTRVLRPGDSQNGVSLLHADPVTGQATFSASGTTFTMHVKEGS